MKKGLKMKILMRVVCAVVMVLALKAQGRPGWDQQKLESVLLHGLMVEDNFPSDADEPPYVPLRERDALLEFSGFLSNSGWTTNQFIEGLIYAVTNNLSEANWLDKDRQTVAGMAMGVLSEINNPAVTNFFRQVNDTGIRRFWGRAIVGMIPYTNLEPEVLAYMRTLCVRTNIYDRAATSVMMDMYETLETMPDALKPAATNRVAQYMYFAIHHETDSQGWQDRELSQFLPAYSNSVQRLDLMRYVATTATNTWERANAERVVQELSSLPTNRLNDIRWITESE